MAYGEKSLVDEILMKVNGEGGHIELTEEVTFKGVRIKVTNIYSNGNIRYQRNDAGGGGIKNSTLSSINDRVLEGILEVIEKNKFI